MSFDFNKLGLDRISQNIAKAVNNPTGGVVTGDITRGEVVEVTFKNATEATANVKERRTVALPGSFSDLSDTKELCWGISGTKLTVKVNTSYTGTISFWVF